VKVREVTIVHPVVTAPTGVQATVADVKGPAPFGTITVAEGGTFTVRGVPPFTRVKVTTAVQGPVFSIVPLTFENGTPMSGINTALGVPQAIGSETLNGAKTVVPRLRLSFPVVPVSPVVLRRLRLSFPVVPVSPVVLRRLRLSFPVVPVFPVVELELELCRFFPFPFFPGKKNSP
jgi:hypothetical protein